MLYETACVTKVILYAFLTLCNKIRLGIYLVVVGFFLLFQVCQEFVKFGSSDQSFSEYEYESESKSWS